MIELDNHSSTEQGSFSDGDISAIKELASITENAMGVITELNVPIIRGKIIGRPWNSLISIAPKDSLELKPFISEGSIAVTEVEFIKKDDVEDITDENGDCDLLGSLKSVTVFIRQGTTSTWFGIEFK